MPRQQELFDRNVGSSAWATTSAFEDVYLAAPWTVASEFNTSSPGSRQQWDVVSASDINLLWNQYAKWGHVRNDELLAKVIEQFKENTAKLYANTLLAGHTPEDPSDYDLKETPDKDFGDWILDDAGRWRISDYGTGKLINLCFQIDDAKSAEDALLLLDQMLNVVHQRSDLAAMFVSGGTDLLDHLFSQEGPAPSFPGTGPMRATTTPMFVSPSSGNARSDISERLDPPSAWVSNPSAPEILDPNDRPSLFWPKTGVPTWFTRAMSGDSGLRK